MRTWYLMTNEIGEGRRIGPHTVPSPDVKGSAKHDVPLPHAVVTNAPLEHSANEAPAHDTSPSVLHVELVAEAASEANCLLSF